MEKEINIKQKIIARQYLVKFLEKDEPRDETGESRINKRVVEDLEKTGRVNLGKATGYLQ